MKRHFSGLLIILGVGLWILAAGYMFIRNKHEEAPENVAPTVGHTAPDFELQGLSGDAVSLQDFRGHAVLINFWATWCGYCYDEMPYIEKYYERYGSDLIVLAVEVGDSISNVRSVVQKYGFTFTVLWDPDSKVFNLYRLRSFPVTFILDPNGIIQIKHQGYLSEDKLVEYLDKVGLSK